MALKMPFLVQQAILDWISDYEKGKKHGLKTKKKHESQHQKQQTRNKLLLSNISSIPIAFY